MRLILLIMIGVSVVFGGDIFSDKSTGLVWQDNSDAKSVKKTWSGAKAYCQRLILAGKNDWRLPTNKELQFIVDIKKHTPAIKDGFKNVASFSYYWSSSESVSNSSNAWRVGFGSGSTNDNDKSNKNYVRCVRGRQ